MTAISGVIITKNEEDRIERAIQSLYFVDEIIVLDSQSTDETVVRARKLGATVFVEEWRGFVQQKNRALELATGPWIISIDADEWVSPQLAVQLPRILDNASHEAFRVPRKNWWGGKVVRFGCFGRDKPVRVFRKASATWAGREPHDSVSVRGSVGLLTASLHHAPYRNLAEHLQTIDRYSSLAARALWQEGKRGSVLHVVLRPCFYFIKDYFVFLGFLEGLRGLLLSLLGSLYVFLKWWKLRGKGCAVS
ncbi:MAG: glycosyltransferase family 2 protein [Myxococcota bacterium]|nr:glycosyltransferase family 2 protein [Myxococcota bacterium]